MAVVRIRAQAHITCYQQLRERRTDDLDPLHDRIIVRVGMASGCVLEAATNTVNKKRADVT